MAICGVQWHRGQQDLRFAQRLQRDGARVRTHGCTVTQLCDVAFAPDDVLCFGSESKGLPPELLEAHAERRVYVPVRAGVRSLNLANVVCLAAYTAMQSAGVPLPDNDGAYEPTTGADGGSARAVRPIDVARDS